MDENITKFPGAPVEAENVQDETTPVNQEEIPTPEDPNTPVEEDAAPEAVSETGEPADSSEEDKQEDSGENEDLIKDPDNPLGSIKDIEALLKQAEWMLKLMEEQWMASARELHITDSNMRELDKWNQDHKKDMPDDISAEDHANWDHWNGIDCITEEEVERIFGPMPHPIYGVQHSQTIDRIKGACNDFFSWVAAMREYRGIHDAYLQLVELEEEKNVEILKKKAEDEPDPEIKAKYEASIAMYYNRKFLEFLAEPLTEEERDRLLITLTDQSKIEYWIDRARAKLGQMKISSKFILEISQFEKRFLDEKYHKNNNILLLYFLNTCAYSQPADKKDDNRVKTTCMVFGLDAIIRKTWPEEKMNRILDNIRAFEDQFLPFIKEPEVDENVTPPISEEASASEETVEESSESSVPDEIAEPNNDTEGEVIPNEPSGQTEYEAAE